MQVETGSGCRIASGTATVFSRRRLKKRGAVE